MKKIYDIELGHYVVINEDENNTENNNTDTENSQQQQPKEENNKSTEANAEISKINQDLNAENKRYSAAKQTIVNTYNTNKQQINDILTAAMDAASKQEVQTTYDKVQTNRDVISARKKMLDLDLKYAEDINRIELEHAKKVNTIENDRLQILTKMNNERFTTLPSKYNSLNESNISQAKLYMNSLISEEDETPIRGMVDFKRAFQDTDIVFGKDKIGYFMLCIDRDDFNKIMIALQKAGYIKDELIGVLMPQILNRSGMITTE